MTEHGGVAESDDDLDGEVVHATDGAQLPTCLVLKTVRGEDELVFLAAPKLRDTVGAGIGVRPSYKWGALPALLASVSSSMTEVTSESDSVARHDTALTRTRT